MYIMKKSYTLNDLQKWKHDPIHAGSVYIKPVNDKTLNYFGWFYYICCCGCFF